MQFILLNFIFVADKCKANETGMKMNEIKNNNTNLKYQPAKPSKDNVLGAGTFGIADKYALSMRNLLPQLFDNV